MPIDPTLLRPDSEGGNVNEVKRWQLSRLRENNESSAALLSNGDGLDCSNKDRLQQGRIHEDEYDLEIEILIEATQKLQKQKNETLKTLNAYRTRLNSLQKSLDPRNRRKRNQQSKPLCADDDAKQEEKDENFTSKKSSQLPEDMDAKISQKENEMEVETSSIREEIQKLKSDIVPSLTKELELHTRELEDVMLPKLGNIVDDCSGIVSDVFASRSFEEIIKQGKKFIHPPLSSDRGKRLPLIDENDRVMDPLYCIGGYETINTYLPSGSSLLFSNETKFSSNSYPNDEREAKIKATLLLTEFGSDLANAISSYAKSFMRKASIKDEKEVVYQSLHSPQNIMITRSKAHSAMGCSNIFSIRKTVNSHINPKSKTKCIVCDEMYNPSGIYNTSPVTVPSYIAMSMIHAETDYSDRVLPKRYVCTSTTTANNGEQRNNYSNNIIKPKLSFSHPMDQIELYGICVCNLIESRMMQHEMIESILSFYNSLMIYKPTNIDKNNSLFFSICLIHRQRIDCDDGSMPMMQLLRSRSLPPSELNPNEGSRVVVEGYMPSMNSYIELAHVSNFTDYISRAFKIKCGGGGGNNDHGKVAEYAHIVHGTFCDVSVALQWVVENNVARVAVLSNNKNNDNTSYDSNVIIEKKKKNQKDINSEEGIVLPQCLTQYMHLAIAKTIPSTSIFPHSILFLPFRRKLIRVKKSGKIKVQDIGNTVNKERFLVIDNNTMKEGYQILNSTWQSTKEDKEVREERRNVSSQCTGNIGSSLNSRPELNSDDILAEQLCNPYDFLPFCNQTTF